MNTIILLMAMGQFFIGSGMKNDSCDVSVITARDLSQYVNECWNDSTATQVGEGACTMLPVNPPIIKFERYRTVWIHKEPTLTGFKEWLIKRKGLK
jgi:hypothetical protein